MSLWVLSKRGLDNNTGLPSSSLYRDCFSSSDIFSKIWSNKSLNLSLYCLSCNSRKFINSEYICSCSIDVSLHTITECIVLIIVYSFIVTTLPSCMPFFNISTRLLISIYEDNILEVASVSVSFSLNNSNILLVLLLFSPDSIVRLSSLFIYIYMVYFYYYLHQFLNNNNPELWVYTIISYDDLHNIHNMRIKK